MTRIPAALVLAIVLAVSLAGPVSGQNETKGEATSGCCVCASAYASTNEEYVDTIREFRDRYLMTNAPGRAVAALYYDVVSPPIAAFLKDNPGFKPPARVVLMPVVYLSKAAVDTTFSEKLAILGGSIAGLAGLGVWVKRRRGRKPGKLKG